MSDKLPITLKGYERLKAELKKMKTADRQEVAREIEIARGHGDLRENADYEAAKEKQGILEANINVLEDRLARAEVIDPSKLSGDRVVFGATVTILDIEADKEQTFQIVGEAEADVKKGRVSVTSPLARALITAEVGDDVKVRSPGGVREYEIVEVEFE
ncbi:MAG: transcription elongation factor GreA [Bradymonadia bacterium]